MKYDRYIKILLFCFFCLISLCQLNAQPIRTIVVVNGSNSPITSLSQTEFRRLYLGVPVRVGNQRVKPLINYSDADIEKLFLQKIIFMSKKKYEQKILSNVYRFGEMRPDKYSDVDLLINELKRSPDTVTYLWQDQVDKYEGIKSIGILWTGQTE